MTACEHSNFSETLQQNNFTKVYIANQRKLTGQNTFKLNIEFFCKDNVR